MSTETARRVESNARLLLAALEMSAAILSGKDASAEVRQTLRQKVTDIRALHPDFKPALTIVQVGGREDSNVYIRMKVKAGEEIGIKVRHLKLPR